MLWEPHQTAFTTWQLASGKTESTTITRQRWIQHLARTYPSETALTITEEQVTQWLANPTWKPTTRKSALQSMLPKNERLRDTYLDTHLRGAAEARTS